MGASSAKVVLVIAALCALGELSVVVIILFSPDLFQRAPLSSCHVGILLGATIIQLFIFWYDLQRKVTKERDEIYSIQTKIKEQEDRLGVVNANNDDSKINALSQPSQPIDEQTRSQGEALPPGARKLFDEQVVSLANFGIRYDALIAELRNRGAVLEADKKTATVRMRAAELLELVDFLWKWTLAIVVIDDDLLSVVLLSGGTVAYTFIPLLRSCVAPARDKNASL